MLEREIEGGPPRHFPERADLLIALVEQGLVTDEQDLLDRRPELVGDIMLNWIQHSQTGCRFATHLAKHRERAGWHVAVVPRRLDEPTFTSVVDGLLCPPPEAAEMVLIAFPWVATSADLAQLIGLLSRCSDWSWEETISIDGADHDQCLVSLRWRLPSNASESWVLGFAPFDFMPFTRRAPYAAIVMRTIDPPEGAGPPEGLASVHLAQVPHFFGGRGVYKGEIWLSTERQRAALLAGELTHAAKARVTFVLPRPLIETLG